MTTGYRGMSLEKLLDPVSSDEEDFDSGLEPISDDDLSNISDIEYSMSDDDCSEIEPEIESTTIIQGDTFTRKRILELSSIATEPTSMLQSEHKRLKFDVSPIVERRTSAPSQPRDLTRRGIPGPMQRCPSPQLTYEVKSCLAEFGDKVDGRNFDIMSLYTWGTKAQLQKALEAHRIFAQRLKEQTSL